MPIYKNKEEMDRQIKEGFVSAMRRGVSSAASASPSKQIKKTEIDILNMPIEIVTPKPVLKHLLRDQVAPGTYMSKILRIENPHYKKNADGTQQIAFDIIYHLETIEGEVRVRHYIGTGTAYKVYSEAMVSYGYKNHGEIVGCSENVEVEYTEGMTFGWISKREQRKDVTVGANTSKTADEDDGDDILDDGNEEDEELIDLWAEDDD